MNQKKHKGVGRPRDEGLIERRCDQILAAATTLFAREGVRQADVQDVADLAQISKGSVYRYFPSKDELFFATVDRGMRRLQGYIQEAVDRQSEPFTQMAVAMYRYLAFFDENPEVLELLIQERAEFKDRKKPTYFAHCEANIGRWSDLLNELVRQGRVREIPVDRINDVIGDLLYGAIFTNYFRGRVKSLKDQARDILDIVFNGIVTDGERPKTLADLKCEAQKEAADRAGRRPA